MNTIKTDIPHPATDLPRRIILSISSDIGMALAKSWLAQGCQVAGTYRTYSSGCSELENAGVHLVKCDLADKDSLKAAVDEIGKLGAWDVLVIAAGMQAPIGSFAETSFDEWEASIDVNFVTQMRVVHELLPYRHKDSARGPLVLFFAGGGTNNATVNYSAYTISKIASIKICELLDAEIPDTRFSILGPGWVKTKIHQETLRAGAKAGDNLAKTIDMLSGNACIPMERVVAGCDWIVGSTRDVVGGRNFSVAYDAWGSPELDTALRTDPDMYKLRRAGNDRMAGRSGRFVPPEQLLTTLLEHLPGVPQHHAMATPEYELLAQTARHLVFQLFGPGNRRPRQFGPFGEINFPYQSMGTIDSLDLFGIDELIIFSFYWSNRHRYRRVVDIGANIGLHSLLLGRCGYDIRSYEPDPVHLALLRRNLSTNAVSHKVEIVEAAVSDHEGSAEFVRVLGNTTGSHLAGAKSNPYGELERFPVALRPIHEIMGWADLVKIDAEGHERQILLATSIDQWQKTDVIVEVGTPETAEALFDHFSKQELNMFAQRSGWNRVQSAQDIPTSHREGSLFITAKKAMPWK